MAWGYRAMFKCLNTYSRKYGLDTIRKTISRWAPRARMTRKHISVRYPELSGVPENGRITATNRDVMIPIVAAMSRVENGVDACMTDVMAGWDLFING